MQILKRVRGWGAALAVASGLVTAGFAAAPAQADNRRVEIYFDGYGGVYFNAQHAHRGHYDYGYHSHRHARGRHAGHLRQATGIRMYRFDNYYAPRRGRRPYCERIASRDSFRGQPAIVTRRVCFNRRGAAFAVRGSRQLVRYIGGRYAYEPYYCPLTGRQLY